MSKDLRNLPSLGCLKIERASRGHRALGQFTTFKSLLVKIEYEHAFASLDDNHLIVVALQAGVLVV